MKTVFHQTKDGVVKRNPIRSIDISQYGASEYASRFGLDPEKTVLHGTSLSNAMKIIEDMMFKNGTFTYPGRGGLEDAGLWAFNSFKEPVVLMAEIDTDFPLKRNMGVGWISIGNRAEEREGLDSIYPSLKIKRLIVFSVPRNISFNHGVFKRIKVK